MAKRVFISLLASIPGAMIGEFVAVLAVFLCDRLFVSADPDGGFVVITFLFSEKLEKDEQLRKLSRFLASFSSSVPSITIKVYLPQGFPIFCDAGSW